MSESQEMLARVRLALAARPGDPAVAAEIGARGIVEAADRLAAAVRPQDARGCAQRWRAAGISLAAPGCGDWPTQLDDLAAPPYLLFRLGVPLRPMLLPSIAIVGSRAATQGGRELAASWAHRLARSGVGVVSGGAFGIDRAAHEGALRAGGPTAAVLAAGVDVDSPRGNAEVLGRIRHQGCVVSEVPPGRPATREGFLVRNRLIAALAPTTLVVEAAQRSGALATARRAGELLRVVLAVPGAAGAPQSTGCHRLIRDGEAILVDRVEDVLEVLRPFSL